MTAVTREKTISVFYFCDGLHPGGKERRLVELIKRLQGKRNVRVALGLMSRDIHYPEVLDLGVPIHFLVRKMRYDPGIVRHLYALLKDERPTMVHTWDPMTSLYALPVVRGLGIPFINGMITNAPPFMPWYAKSALIARLTFPFSDLVVSNSFAGLKAYRVPPSKGICIHNGFDPARIQRANNAAERRKALGIDTRLVVGMVGEFAEKKDYRTYVDAAQRVLAVRDDVTFLAVGDGAMRDALCRSIHPAYQGRILFTGWVSPVESTISIMDVGVLATNASLHGEGIPNVVLEYMALGKPVVATDAGGTREILADGETGFLVKNGDAAMLAGRVQELLADPGMAREMGERGRHRVETNFTIDLMTEHFFSLYQYIAGKAR